MKPLIVRRRSVIALEGRSGRIARRAQFMGSNDTLKTAKTVRNAEDQALDGCHDKRVRKAKKKERQKGKSVIKQELVEYNRSKPCKSKD